MAIDGENVGDTMMNKKSNFTLILIVLLLGTFLTSCSSSKKNKKFGTVGEEKIIARDDGSVDVVQTKTLDQHLKVERAAKIRAQEERDFWKRKVKELEKENYSLRARLNLKGKRKKRMPTKYDEKGNVIEWDRPKGKDLEEQIEAAAKNES